MELFDINVYFRNTDKSLGKIFVEGVESVKEALTLVKEKFEVNPVLAVVPSYTKSDITSEAA